MRKLLAIIGDALFRPAQFVRLMNSDDCYACHAYIATLLWLCLTNGLIAFVMQWFFSISTFLVINGLVKSFFDAISLSSYAMIISGIISSRNHRLDGFQIIVKHPAKAWSGVLFWLLYGQIHITPLCLIFSLVRILRGLPWNRNLFLGSIFMLGLGLMIGTMITIIVGYFRSAQTARRIMAIAVLGLIALLGVLGELAVVIGWLVLLGGIFIGIIRLISWFWQALLSLILLWLVRFNHPLVWKLHPAMFDELTLLPLPGLSALLVKLYRQDPQIGVQVMLRIYAYGGQRRAIRQALNRIVRDQQLTTPALLALSTNPEGAVLLHELTEQLHRIEPLIEVYAQLSAVSEPQAWPAVIAKVIVHPQLTTAYGDGIGLQSFLQAAQRLLDIHEWTFAYQQLIAMPSLEGDSVWYRAYAALRSQAAALNTPKDLIQSTTILTDPQLQIGWPAHLLASVIEHLQYLRQVQLNQTM